MIAKGQIERELKILLKHFDASNIKIEADLFGRLAIIELCGWIEESWDDIVKKYTKRKIRSLDLQKYIEEEIVKNNHGFKYKENIKRMLISVFGVSNFKKIEREINNKMGISALENFSSILGSLKKKRDDFAHKHASSNTSKTAESPSISLSSLEKVFPIMKEFERAAKKIAG